MSILARGEIVNTGNDEKLKTILTSWTQIHYHLPDLSLDEIERMVYLEVQGEGREKVLRRLVGRASRLTVEMDLEELGIHVDRSTD